MLMYICTVVHNYLSFPSVHTTLSNGRKYSQKKHQARQKYLINYIQGFVACGIEIPREECVWKSAHYGDFSQYIFLLIFIILFSIFL